MYQLVRHDKRNRFKLVRSIKRSVSFGSKLFGRQKIQNQYKGIAPDKMRISEAYSFISHPSPMLWVLIRIV